MRGHPPSCHVGPECQSARVPECQSAIGTAPSSVDSLGLGFHAALRAMFIVSNSLGVNLPRRRCRRTRRPGLSTRCCRCSSTPARRRWSGIGRPSVGVQNRAGDVALADRVAGRRDRHACFHSEVDRVADDLVRLHIVHRAEVDFAFIGAMLGGGTSCRRLPAGECPSTTAGSGLLR